MKSKVYVIILILLGVLYICSPFFITDINSIERNNSNNSEYSDGFDMDKDTPKISTISGKIHINNNWSAAKAAGICTGNGTYTEPYTIQDLVIDGGGSGSGILIENSVAYVKIENCKVSNYGNTKFEAGIRLNSVKNLQLINNNCSSNFVGIILYNTSSINITANTVTNTYCGI